MDKVHLILSALLYTASASESLALPVWGNAKRMSSELKAPFEEEDRHTDFTFHQGDFQQGEVDLQIKLWCWVAKTLTHYSNIYK